MGGVRVKSFLAHITHVAWTSDSYLGVDSLRALEYFHGKDAKSDAIICGVFDFQGIWMSNKHYLGSRLGSSAINWLLCFSRFSEKSLTMTFLNLPDLIRRREKRPLPQLRSITVSPQAGFMKSRASRVSSSTPEQRK